MTKKIEIIKLCQQCGSAGCQQLMPVILAPQEAEIDQKDHGSKPAPWANSLQDPISKKPFTKIGLVEWLKVKALSSSPSTAKQNNKQC
jgi:hypothetical protein